MIESCITHPSESATGRCATCSRPYCGLCMVEDVSSELAFCSDTCRVAHRYGPPSDRSEEFIAALKSPIRTGWRLAMQRIVISSSVFSTAGK
jgi:hypothetical protein